MINNTFKDTFNFLASSLNNLVQFTKNNKNGSESLRRMLDTIQFIHDKQTAFSLKDLRDELVQLRGEADKLGNQLPNIGKNSLMLVVKSLIDGLIIEIDTELEKRQKIDAELEKRQKQEQSAKKTMQKSVKVRIFKSSFADEVEKEMNSFLEKNPNIEIINTLQNVENNVVCITLFYK
jgi:hypothetical protein